MADVTIVEQERFNIGDLFRIRAIVAVESSGTDTLNASRLGIHRLISVNLSGRGGVVQKRGAGETVQLDDEAQAVFVDGQNDTIIIQDPDGNSIDDTTVELLIEGI